MCVQSIYTYFTNILTRFSYFCITLDAYQIIALNTKIIPKIDEYNAHFSHLVLLSFCSDDRSSLTRFSDFCVMKDMDSEDFLLHL